jgi:hypothetical protein
LRRQSAWSNLAGVRSRDWETSFSRFSTIYDTTPRCDAFRTLAGRIDARLPKPADLQEHAQPRLRRIDVPFIAVGTGYGN